MADNENPKIICYDGSSKSLKQIAKDIRNISCGTSLQSKFVLNQDGALLFYHQNLDAYPEWSEKFIRSFVVHIGQYIVQYYVETPFIFSTMEEVNEFIKPKKQNSPLYNAKPEQSIDQEQLMSQIEDMALEFANSLTEDDLITIYLRRCDPFKEFQKKLKSLFQTHRNTVSTVENVKNDNLVDEDKLRSKIKSVLNGFDNLKRYSESDKKTYSKRLLELFKAYQNSVYTTVKQKDEIDDK